MDIIFINININIFSIINIIFTNIDNINNNNNNNNNNNSLNKSNNYCKVDVGVVVVSCVCLLEELGLKSVRKIHR